MIEKITYIESNQFSPYRNLAVEEYLLLHCEGRVKKRKFFHASFAYEYNSSYSS